MLGSTPLNGKTLGGHEEDVRTKRPRPKRFTEAAVPKELRAFLKNVTGLIAERDEATTIPSDDLLQSRRVYGGLIDGSADQYGFTFFPGEGTRRKWELQLSAAQIADVARREIQRFSLWACVDDSCGSMFWSEKETCFHCDWVDDQVPALPAGKFGTRRDWALAYFALHPESHPLEMVGEFNGNSHLATSLGQFSLEEATEVLAAFKRGL